MEVTIGLDFGTHSTKVVFRKDLEDHGTLLVLAPAPDNSQVLHAFADVPYPPFAIPSVVGLHAGVLVFGEEARRLSPAEKHYALKGTLLKDEPALGESWVTALECRSTDEAVDLLAAAFLAWVLAKVHKFLDTNVGPGRWSPITCVGAPMDQYEDDHLKRRYERILFAACEGGLEGGELDPDPSWSLDGDFVGDLRRLMRQPMPEAGERRFEVLPETVAGMIPLSHDPRWDGGLYNVIDIGGGTTEVSVVHLKQDPERTIDCRGDKSIPVGGLLLRKYESERSGVDPFESILSTLRRVWDRGHKLDADSHQARAPWHRTCVLQAGGGWIAPRFAKLVLRKHPARSIYNPKIYRDYRCRCDRYAPSREILLIGSTKYSEGLTRAQFHFLPVALGLAFWPEWPDWYRPSQARPALPDERDLVEYDPTWGHS